MAHGKLKAVGTPLFLKTHFIIGYRLFCVKKPSCNVSTVTNLLQKYLPSIQIATNIGTELTYVLEKCDETIFPQLLGDLEKNSEALELESFGISMPSLEEVFHKYGISK